MGPVLRFSIFDDITKTAIQCTLSKFTDCTKLCVAVVESQYGGERCHPEEPGHTLERWADANLMMFINVKYKVCIKETFLCDHPEAILAVILAPLKLRLKPLHGYTPHTHNQIRFPYQLYLRFSIAES